MSTQLATQDRRADPVSVIRQNLTAMAPQFQAALPAHITVEKFTRVAMTAIQNNPALANADRQSLFGSIVRLAQDGLLPDGREAAIVMFGNKAQAMPMIAGVLKKIRQSGDVSRVSAQVVYENDDFVWKLGFDEDVTHNPPPLDKPRGKAIGAYATAVLKDGSRLLEVMSLEEIEAVRNVSRAKGNGPWVQWWGEMARKTVMRRLSKRLPMSTDLMDEIDRSDPTLPANDDVIEHEPQQQRLSRLDQLEEHIGAAQEETIHSEPQPADIDDGSADDDAAIEEPAIEAEPVQEAEEKPSLAERMAANADAEKARQGGTKPALTLAAAKAEIDRLELVTDIRSYLSDLRGQLSDTDLGEADEYGFAKIAGLEGGA
jgi:recombination protein RecT